MLQLTGHPSTLPSRPFPRRSSSQESSNEFGIQNFMSCHHYVMWFVGGRGRGSGGEDVRDEEGVDGSANTKRKRKRTTTMESQVVLPEEMKEEQEVRGTKRKGKGESRRTHQPSQRRRSSILLRGKRTFVDVLERNLFRCPRICLPVCRSVYVNQEGTRNG